MCILVPKSGWQASYGRLIELSAVLSGTTLAQQPLQIVTGKKISPVGTNSQVGNLPMNMIKSPDGKYGIISDMGFNQWLSSANLSTGVVISQVDFGQQPNDSLIQNWSGREDLNLRPLVPNQRQVKI